MDGRNLSLTKCPYRRLKSSEIQQYSIVSVSQTFRHFASFQGKCYRDLKGLSEFIFRINHGPLILTYTSWVISSHFVFTTHKITPTQINYIDIIFCLKACLGKAVCLSFFRCYERYCTYILNALTTLWIDFHLHLIKSKSHYYSLFYNNIKVKMFVYILCNWGVRCYFTSSDKFLV